MQPRLSHRMGDREFARAGAIIGVKCGLRFHEGNREILEDGLKRAATAEDRRAALLSAIETASTTDAVTVPASRRSCSDGLSQVF